MPYRLTHYPLTHQLHTANSFLNCKYFFSYFRNFPHFTEPRGSLPYAQQLATGLCDVPDKTSPYSRKVYCLFKVHLIFYFLPRHDAQSEYRFFSSLWTKMLYGYCNSPIQAKCPTNIYFYKSKSFSLIIWSNNEFRFHSGVPSSTSRHLADNCLFLLAPVLQRTPQTLQFQHVHSAGPVVTRNPQLLNWKPPDIL
jgi:hypothetical protein